MGLLITYRRFREARKNRRHRALLMDAKSVTERLRKLGYGEDHFYKLAMQGIPPAEWEAALGVDKDANLIRALKELELNGYEPE